MVAVVYTQFRAQRKQTKNTSAMEWESWSKSHERNKKKIVKINIKGTRESEKKLIYTQTMTTSPPLGSIQIIFFFFVSLVWEVGNGDACRRGLGCMGEPLILSKCLWVIRTRGNGWTMAERKERENCRKRKFFPMNTSLSSVEKFKWREVHLKIHFNFSTSAYWWVYTENVLYSIFLLFFYSV